MKTTTLQLRKLTFLELVFDVSFKSLSVIGTTLTVTLMVKGLLMIEDMMYLFYIAVFGAILGIFIAFFVYRKFYENGNIVGLLIVGTIMVLFYVLSSSEAYNTYRSLELKKDAIYNVYIEKKSRLIYDEIKYKEQLSEFEKMKLDLLKKYAEAQTEKTNFIKNKDNFLLIELGKSKQLKWKDEENKIKNKGQKYIESYMPLQKMGYKIEDIYDIPQARYSLKLKQLESLARLAYLDLNSTKISSKQAYVNSLSSDFIVEKMAYYELKIQERIDIVESKLSLTADELDYFLLFWGIFVEIILSSVFFLIDVFNALMKKYKLVTTLHLIEIEDDQPVLDANVMLLENKVDELSNYLFSYGKMYDLVKEQGGIKEINIKATGEKQRRINNYNQTILGIIVATIATSKNNFTEVKGVTVQQYMTQEFKDNVPRNAVDVKGKRFFPFGGNCRRHFSDAQNALSIYDLKSLDLESFKSLLK